MTDGTILRLQGEPLRPPEQKAVNINPTFLLRGVDPIEILQRYIGGEFRTRTIPETRVEASTQVVLADHIVGKNADSEIYDFLDRNNTTRRVVTSNHRNYAIVRDRLNRTRVGLAEDLQGLPEGQYVCHNCRTVRTDIPIGIPIKMEYYPNEKISIFHVEGTYHSFECALEIIKHKTACLPIIRDAHYMDSEAMLRSMFHQVHPDGTLGIAKDWILLRSNGGPLSWDEFSSNHHIYQKTPNVIVLPIKIEHLRSGPTQSILKRV